MKYCLPTIANTVAWTSKTMTLCFLLFFRGADAFILTTDTELNFGELAIPRNNNVSTVTVTRTGRSWSTGSVFILNQGTPGEYTFSNLPPFTKVTLSIMLPVESTTSFTTPPLRITAVDMQNELITDTSGEASFIIGATLSTSGTGDTYVSSATYPFFIPLEITF